MKLPSTEEEVARRVVSLFAIFLLFGLVPLQCAAQDDSDPEAYKFRFNAQWWIADPVAASKAMLVPSISRRISISATTAPSTGCWNGNPAESTTLTCISHPIRVLPHTFSTGRLSSQGETFFVGETVHTKLQSFIISPGYEYDFISRPRGHFGVDFLVNLFVTTASIQTQGGIVGPGGTVTTARYASKSLFAPLPTGGPTFATPWCHGDFTWMARSPACTSSAMATSSQRVASLTIRWAIT